MVIPPIPYPDFDRKKTSKGKLTQSDQSEALLGI
jgi:hypothetical protein